MSAGASDDSPDLIGAAIRAAVGDVVRRELETAMRPVREALEALQKSAPPPLVDLPAFCNAAGVSASTARRWARTGLVKTVRRGRVLRFDLTSLRPANHAEIGRLAREARGGR